MEHFTPVEEEVLSAGILCYAYTETTHDIFFLLGRERPALDWPRGSNRWSDFGGCLIPGETEVHGAAREFVEETMAVVPFAAEEMNVSRFVDVSQVERVLDDKKFTFRVAVDVSDRAIVTENEHSKKLRVCYVKRIPWQPDLPERFDQVRDVLDRLATLASENMERAIEFYDSLTSDMKHHPAIVLARREEGDSIQSISVKAEYREKNQIGWWSLHRLKAVIKNGGAYKNKYCFRIGFLSTLAVVVEHFSIMEFVCQQLMNDRRDYILDVSQSIPPIQFEEPLPFHMDEEPPTPPHPEPYEETDDEDEPVEEHLDMKSAAENSLSLISFCTKIDNGINPPSASLQ